MFHLEPHFLRHFALLDGFLKCLKGLLLLGLRLVKPIEKCALNGLQVLDAVFLLLVVYPVLHCSFLVILLVLFDRAIL